MINAPKKERRKHRRFSATAFLNRAVHLFPLPLYFGHDIKGKLIDLSAGGISILIGELIPQGTFLNLKMTFPDHTVMESVVNAKYVFPRGKQFLHGFEFLTLSPQMAERIAKMSTDYIDCEARIKAEQKEICQSNCAFFTMCNKEEKMELVTEIETTLDLALQEIKDYSPEKSPS
jgi:hypothetical protein